MKRQMTPGETLREFCRTWFVQRDAERTLAFLTEDVGFVGTGTDEMASGRQQMAGYLAQDIREIPEPFECELSPIYEQPVADGIYNMSADLTLKNSKYTWYLRAFFTLVLSGEEWLVKSFHVAEPASSQKDAEHYPGTLVMEHTSRLRQELLNNSLPGGMMGGYIEDGFPFYFINRRMLEYLGYENETEFVSDIEGMITNCMHPDDRNRVDQLVACQLQRSEEYVVEYRMKKKDGSYIWVHDLGRVVTAEDGRLAISSVCLDITVQKHAQQEVMNLYNNIPGAVFRCRFDPDYSVIDANDGLFEYIGYTREEFAAMGNRMSAVIHPEDLAVMADKLSSQLLHGNTIHNENRLVCKDGSVKWVSVKAQLFSELQGERHFYCVCLDITEEKQLQKHVRELYEKELSYFAEISSVGGCLQGRLNVSKNRVENYLSSTAVPIAGIGETYDEIIENLAASAVDAEYGRKILCALNRKKVLADYAAGKVNYSFEFLRRNEAGELFWGSTGFSSCLHPETGDVIAFFYTKDITEAKLQEQLLGTIASLDYDAIAEVDMVKGSRRIINFKHGLTNTVSEKGEYLEALRNVADRCMDEAAREEYLAKMNFTYMKEQLENQDSYSFVLELKEDDGSVRVKRYQAFYISKELGRVCITRTDVTDVARREQRQKEELASALIAAEQANAAKSDFLSRMSHEIRTPMNAIIGMTAIAAQALGNDEQVADCISKIGISSRFLLSLINDILDMSKIENGKMKITEEPFSLGVMMREITDILLLQTKEKNIHFTLRAENEEDAFEGDSMHIKQILLNLLSNAVKFTPEGGSILLEAGVQPEEKGILPVRFLVKDTGIGIAREDQERIFKAFEQVEETESRQMGTGLGLSISRSLTELMGGTLSVESCPGKGAAFSFTLPLRRGTLCREDTSGCECRWEDLRVLLAEDNEINAEITAEILKMWGIRTDLAADGKQAVQCFADSRPETYGMILMDLKMPVMDGLKAARAIRHMGREDSLSVPIVAMTANTFQEDVEAAEKAGMNGFLAKPVDVKKMQDMIEKFCRASVVYGNRQEKNEEGL